MYYSKESRILGTGNTIIVNDTVVYSEWIVSRGHENIVQLSKDSNLMLIKDVKKIAAYKPETLWKRFLF